MGGLAGLYGDAVARMRTSAALRRSFLAWIAAGLVVTGGLSEVVGLLHSATAVGALAPLPAIIAWWGAISVVVFGGASWLRTPQRDAAIDRYGVPNGLTAIRAYACLPLLFTATVSLPGRSGLALWCTIGFVTGMLDAVDGFIARRVGPLTELGRAMDPASDALFFATAAVGNVALGILPPWVAALLLIRYLGPLGLTPIVFLLRKRPELVHTKWGRRNTALTGLVIFCCMWVRIFNGPVDTVALVLTVPLLLTTTLLHFWSLIERTRHAPSV